MNRSPITPPFNNNNDVILLGRGYDSYTSPGNEFFRILCSKERSSVQKKRLRPSEKVDMINKIMTVVKSKGGRFVEENGSEWVEVTDERARQIISGRLKPSNLSPPQPNSVVIITSKPRQHSQRVVVAAAAPPSDTMEAKPTTKDVNTADTTKDITTAEECPAMNTRSKTTSIPDEHQVQPINRLASFVIKRLLTDSSNKDAHAGMCSHFDQLLTQPSKEPSNEGQGLNLTVVVGPYNANNVGLNVTRTKTYLQQQHGKNEGPIDANNNTVERYTYGRKRGAQSTGITQG